jgi:hypothetical protein
VLEEEPVQKILNLLGEFADSAGEVVDKYSFAAFVVFGCGAVLYLALKWLV